MEPELFVTFLKLRSRAAFSVQSLSVTQNGPELPVPLRKMDVGRVGVDAAEKRRGDDEIGRGPVVRDGNVVDLCDAQKRLHVGIMRLSGKRIGEEDDDVDMSLGYFGSDLLIAAERTAEVGSDGQPRSFIDEMGRRAGTAEKMAGQQLRMLGAPFDEAFLHVVVGDQGNVLGGVHCLFHGVFSLLGPDLPADVFFVLPYKA